MMKLGKFTGGKSRGKWYLRLAVLVICLFAVIVIYVSNQLLTQRFTETISNRSEVRLALYVTNLMNELQRNSVVPQLLSQKRVRQPDQHHGSSDAMKTGRASTRRSNSQAWGSCILFSSET